MLCAIMTAAPSDDYTVILETFQGPLDLLLFLIRRAEVDIADIPIATITDQYVAYLRGLSRIDIETAGEFLVMAATLMEIKSRMLMPPEPRQPGEEGGEASAAGEGGDVPGLDAADPRYELVKQLLAYKRFRDAAETLDRMREGWLSRYPTARAATVETPAQEVLAPDNDEHNEAATELEDVGVWDLFEVFQRIIEAVDFTRLGSHKVEYDDTPILLHQEDLLDQLGRSPEGGLSLRAACAGRRKGEMIGLFLATLELARQRKVRIVQDRIADDILLVPRNDQDDEDQAPTDAPLDQSSAVAAHAPNSGGNDEGEDPGFADACEDHDDEPGALDGDDAETDWLDE